MSDDTPDDFDSPWKEALEHALPDFLALFFPEAYAGIDWSQGFRFCDTELQQVVRDAELGRRYADKLAAVYTRDGAETWVLVHIEIQGQPDPGFAERMYVYHYRLFDRYRRDVVSLAVLTDAQGGFRPGAYTREQILAWFRVLDWILRLPEDLEQEFRVELIAFEEEAHMPYVTSVERIGIQKGRREGEAAILIRQITLKFGPPPESVRAQIQAADADKLLDWSASILTAERIEDIFA